MIAPIFKKKTLGPKAAEYMAKWRKQEEVSSILTPGRVCLFTPSLKHALESGSDTLEDSKDLSSGSNTDANSDEGLASQTSTTPSLQTGQPTLDILDQLMVELESLLKMPRKYKCAGAGCSKTWQPRSQARVLAHGKLCLHLSSSL